MLINTAITGSIHRNNQIIKIPINKELKVIEILNYNNFVSEFRIAKFEVRVGKFEFRVVNFEFRVAKFEF